MLGEGWRGRRREAGVGLIQIVIILVEHRYSARLYCKILNSRCRGMGEDMGECLRTDLGVGGMGQLVRP